MFPGQFSEGKPEMGGRAAAFGGGKLPPAAASAEAWDGSCSALTTSTSLLPSTGAGVGDWASLRITVGKLAGGTGQTAAWPMDISTWGNPCGGEDGRGAGAGSSSTLPSTATLEPSAALCDS